MKQRSLLLAIVFILALAGCQAEMEFVEGSLRPGPAEASLSGGNVTMNFPASAGSASVDLNASGDWTASFVNDRAKDWCSISKESGGRGVASITVSVRENPDYDQRSATINFTCGELRRTIVVTQKQKEAILVTSNRVDVGKAGGRISVEVKANVTFDYAVSEGAKDWIKAVGTKALSTTTLLFDVSANDAVEKREGEIVVSGSAGREVVKVYQEGETPTLVVSKNKYDLTCDAQEIRVEVQHNVDVVLEIPSGCDWLRETSTKSMSTSTFSLTVDENEAFADRSCELRFRAPALNMEEKVVVRQAAAEPQIIIGEGVYEFGVEGGELSIDVQSNFGISVEVPDTCSWIRMTGTKALTTKTYGFFIEENETLQERTGVIVFRNESLGITEQVIVRQAAAVPQLFIGEGLYEFDAAGGDLEIDVTSNFGVTVSVPDTCSWIRPVGTKALVTDTYSFIIEENETFQDRSGVIVFHNETLGITEKVVVRQKAVVPQIIIGDGLYEFGAEGGDLSIYVTSNFGVSVSVPDTCSWIRPVGTKALSTRAFGFTVEENETFVDRSGVIVFYNELLGVSDKVIVRQAAAVPQIIIGEGVYEFDAAGGDLAIDVTSNFGVTVSVPDTCAWIQAVDTKSLTTKTFNFTVEENESFADRSGVIVFRNESLDITEKVIVRQRQHDALMVSGKYFEIPAEGGQVEVQVSHNVDYVVINSTNWIHEVKAKSLTTDVLQFTVDANDDLYAREGTVRIHSAHRTDTLVFVQDHEAYFLRLKSPESRDLSPEGGTLTLVLEHNPYGFRFTQCLFDNEGHAEYGDNYLFMPGSRRDVSDNTRQTTVTVRYTKNPLRRAREGYAILSDFDHTTSDTLVFSQAPRTILTSEPEIFIPADASELSFRVAGTDPGAYQVEKKGYSSWLQFIGTQTDGEETVYRWKAEANTGKAMRKADVEIYPADGGWPDVFRVCQEGSGLYVSVTYSSRLVTAPALYGPYREQSTIWWGDGSSQPFADGAFHRYAGGGKHTITVRTNRMEYIDWAEVSSFESGMNIDFSHIRVNE